MPRFALLEVTRNKGGDAVLHRKGIGFEVETKFGFALLFVGAVAEEALVRENRANIATEVDRCIVAEARHREAEEKEKTSQVHPERIPDPERTGRYAIKATSERNTLQPFR